MNPVVKPGRLVAIALCALPPFVFQLAAQQPSPESVSRTNVVQYVPSLPAASPVATFRRLLAMTPEQLEGFLTNYAAERREQIQQKVEEYHMLPVDFCELRLRVTELRWYLLPLLRAAPENRAELLKAVPEPFKELIGARLEEWDLWPPSLKEDVLEYESTMRHFVDKNAEVQPQPVFEDLPENGRAAQLKKLADWSALPVEQRRQLYGGFRNYFELSEQEQQKILDSLYESDRRETEKVVNSIEKWPKSQQESYFSAFWQFAEMSEADRRQFMKNAARWRKMSDPERRIWRDLVQQFSSASALPPGLPPLAQPTGPSAASAGTNSSATVKPTR